jgi:hypothetical protein
MDDKTTVDKSRDNKDTLVGRLDNNLVDPWHIIVKVCPD